MCMHTCAYVSRGLEELADARGRERRLEVDLEQEDGELFEVDHAGVVEVRLVEDALDTQHRAATVDEVLLHMHGTRVHMHAYATCV